MFIEQTFVLVIFINFVRTFFCNFQCTFAN